MEVTGRQVAVDVFPEGIAEFGQQRECRKLDMGGGSGWGESRRERGLSIHHLKGARPQGLSGQSPYSEENNWRKFSLIKMYFEG